MKLFYCPGACSMAPHIVLREAGYTFGIEAVDLDKGVTATGEDYLAINPKGYVPALQLDDGEILTEVTVILQYLADHRPAAGLAPAAGTMERYRLLEWLTFISSEIHQTLGVLFNPALTPEWKENRLMRFGSRCDYLASVLVDRPYLTGETFTIADAYLFTVLGWTGLFNIDMIRWPALTQYSAHIAGRPAVRAAMQAEGLIG